MGEEQLMSGRGAAHEYAIIASISRGAHEHATTASVMGMLE